MRGLNRALFRKELALQKTNMMFMLGTVLLGSIALVVFSVVEFRFATVTSSDLKNMVIFMAVAPLLIGVIPVMLGATAAAAEKPLGVLAWQDALPVARWRVAVIKLAVVVLGVCVVSGVMPFVMLTLHMALEDRTVEFASAFKVFSVFGGWIVPVGLICAAVGFYTGAFARNDYQALLMAVIPLGLVVYVMFLADPLGRVFPVIMDEWPTKPLVMTRRLVIIAALFAGLGCGLLGRVPRRRWVVMVGHGVLVAVVVFGLTLWNIVAEYRVLSYGGGARAVVTPPSGGDEVYSMSSTLVSVQRSSEGYFPGWDMLSKLEEVEIPGEQRMAIGYLMRNDSYYSDASRPLRPFLIFHNEDMPAADPDGLEVVEFPQAVVERDRVRGVARNKRWIQTRDMLFGPWGLSVRRGMIPQGWFERLSERVGIRPIAKERGPVERQDGEIIVGRGEEDGIAWYDGQKYVPGATHLPTALNSTVLEDPEHVRVMVNDGGPTAVAILKPVELEGLPYRYELAGWSSGPFGSVSEDYKWVVSMDSERTAFAIARLEVDSPLRDGVTSDSASGVWALPARRAVDDATSLSLAFAQNPFLEVDGEDYVAFRYLKINPAHEAVVPVPTEPDVPFETGVMLFNPARGEETFFPVTLPVTRWLSAPLRDRARQLTIIGNGKNRIVVTSGANSMVGMIFSAKEPGGVTASVATNLSDGVDSERGFFLNDNTFIYCQPESVKLMMF